MLAAKLTQRSDKSAPLLNTEMADRMVETLGSLKGIALKFGQGMALSQDMQPEAVKKLLYQMFSNAPSLDFSVVRELLQAELGQDIEALFEEFAPEAFAAASLGQVHRATLKSGEAVAVKVQYPKAAQTLRHDLNNLASVMRTAGLGLNLFDEKGYIDEFQTQFSEELDYSLERRRLEHFRTLLEPWPDLMVPRTYPNVSTSRVLVTELLNGKTLTVVCAERDAYSPKERYRIGEQLIRAIYGPFLTSRTMHGDCHPGNFVTMPDGRLGVLDLGCMKEFSFAFWQSYRRTIQSALEGNFSNVLEITAQAGFRIQVSDEQARSLLLDLSHIVCRPFRGDYDFSQCRIREDVTALVRQRPQDFLRVRPPAEGIFFFRSIVGLSDILRALGSSGDFRTTFSELMQRTPPPHASR